MASGEMVGTGSMWHGRARKQEDQQGQSLWEAGLVRAEGPSSPDSLSEGQPPS